MARAALETLTSTKRNRQHFSFGKNKSQELAQTILRMTMAKWKTRDALMSLESIRRGTGMLISNNNMLLVNWCRQYPQHEHHVFPFGLQLFEKRRTVPRTREMKLEDGTEKAQSAISKATASTTMMDFARFVAAPVSYTPLTLPPPCYVYI